MSVTPSGFPSMLSYVLFSIFACVTWLYVKWLCNPLRLLPGPPTTSLIGYARAFWVADPTKLHEEWVERFGQTLSYRVFGHTCLYTVDLKALSHILLHDSVYHKPPQVCSFIAEMLGSGLLLSEGDSETYVSLMDGQAFPYATAMILFVLSRIDANRRGSYPAFGPLQLRRFHEIFLDNGSRLADLFYVAICRNAGSTTVDMYAWIHRLTLEVICEAAFGYHLGALDEELSSSPLCDALRLVSQSVTRLSLFPMLRFFFPVLRIIPDEQTRRFKNARHLMRQFAMQVIRQKREETVDSTRDDKHLHRRNGNLLSLLVEANAGLGHFAGLQISDDTMIDNCCTFLVAGHETTATTISWLFYNLGCHLDVQRKLRDEIFNVATARPSMETLTSLHYLDCVVREVIRLHPPIPSSLRMSVEDDLIHLGTPVAIDSQTVDHIFVPKGTPIVIPILAINRDRAIWGEDASMFRPERWDALPQAAQAIPGIWGHSLTFMGGHHACIGFRFGLNEIKAVVFTMLRSFEFKLVSSPEDIGPSPTLIQRPIRISDPDGGPQLPLLMRPCSQERVP